MKHSFKALQIEASNSEPDEPQPNNKDIKLLNK
jgi:hypothetical protein